MAALPGIPRDPAQPAPELGRWRRLLRRVLLEFAFLWVTAAILGVICLVALLDTIYERLRRRKS